MKKHYANYKIVLFFLLNILCLCATAEGETIDTILVRIYDGAGYDLYALYYNQGHQKVTYSIPAAQTLEIMADPGSIITICSNGYCVPFKDLQLDTNNDYIHHISCWGTLLANPLPCDFTD